MSAAPRRNDLDLIARLAPTTISFLQVPLTPARAARLADFTARKGIDAQALVLDLLDDVIFDMPPRCADDLGSATRTLPISLGGGR